MFFLEETAEYLHRKGLLSKETCLVFPNKRAGFFFSKYYSGLIDSPVWMPAYCTTGGWVESFSGLASADRLELILKLHEIYRSVFGVEIGLDEFYSLGETLLSDFNEIDKYRIKASDIYSNISDLKDIESRFDYLSEQQIKVISEFWSGFSRDNEIRRKFRLIWNNLAQIHDLLWQYMDSQSKGYEGFILNRSVDILQETGQLPYSRYIFIGFNALNKCETELMKIVQKRGKAMFFWDYDNYYLNHDYEAGRFLKEHIRLFPMPEDFEMDCNRLSDRTRSVRIHQVPSYSEQAGVMSDILKKYTESDIRTAVVLPDENLLVPVLHSIPDNITSVNISMGYPFTATPAWSLLESMIAVTVSARDSRFRLADLLGFLSHPYILNIPLFKDHSYRIQKMYVTLGEVMEEFDCDPGSRSLLEQILTRVETGSDFISWLGDICRICMAHITDEDPDHAYHEEYLAAMQNRLSAVSALLNPVLGSTGLKTIQRIVREQLRSLRIPFSGEPLQGVQILGLLETRCLNFDHLVILSANEGILPKLSDQDSYIPYSIRKSFGLPTTEHQDSIYAYYFFRLLQGARQVDIIYNTVSPNGDPSEKSRFLLQMEYEDIFNSPEEIVHNFDSSILIPKVTPYRQDEYSLRKLSRYLSGGDRALSPSDLKDYRKCRLLFKYKKIDDLKEPATEMKDIDDPLMFGNILHKTMQYLYSPPNIEEGETVTRELLSKLKGRPLKEAMLRAFNETTGEDLKDISQLSGWQSVIFETLLRFAGNIINTDSGYAPFLIHSLEKRVSRQFMISTDGESESWVSVSGIADRIDLKDDQLRIIDYKTGRNDALTIKSIDKLFDDGKGNPAMLQVLIYSLILSEDLKLPVTQGLYLVTQNTSDWEFRIDGKPLGFDSVKDEFATSLSAMLSEIFSKENVFTPTRDERNCKDCAYRILCCK